MEHPEKKELNNELNLTYQNEVETRLDLWLSEVIGDYSRSYIGKLIGDEKVKVNGKAAKPSYKMRKGDTVSVCIQLPAKENEALPENIEIKIVYEDEDIIVVDKPKGMVVHPAAGNWTGTLVNALLGKYGSNLSNINGVIRPGIVHRIDKDTSGLLVVARNNKAHQFLSELLKKHEIKRVYTAVTEGAPLKNEFIVNAPIGRHPTDRLKMAVVKTGKAAITKFRVIERFGSKAALIRAELETGRTHQIRVHSMFAGYPLLGDEVYNKRTGLKKNLPDMQGQMLHAGYISLMHPTKGKLMEFESPLPEAFKSVLEVLKEVCI